MTYDLSFLDGPRPTSLVTSCGVAQLPRYVKYSPAMQQKAEGDMAVLLVKCLGVHYSDDPR